jgi:uncharacterized protein (DUF433 family)
MNGSSRITIQTEHCGGRPCIRGLRIRVIDVLDLLANGLTHQDILAEFPELESEDIVAAIHFARNKIDHPIVAA